MQKNGVLLQEIEGEKLEEGGREEMEEAENKREKKGKERGQRKTVYTNISTKRK